MPGAIRHHEPVGTGLRAPHLARAAQQLADICSRPGQREPREVSAGGIEAHEGVGAEVRKPDQVGLVDVHGVGLDA
jgi:hypothetical protein